jgi:hypothetical protein
MKLAALAWLLAALLAWSAAALDAAAQDAVRIGTIKTLRGDAQIIGAGGSVAATVGGAVRQNDTLETGTDGALGLSFIDDTTLSMGPKSRITLTKVVFDPDQSNFAFATSIAKGTFMFVSGSIAKLAPQTVQITTPVNTIGIRGTRFLVRID